MSYSDSAIVNNPRYVVVIKNKSYVLEFEQTALLNPSHFEEIEFVKSGELLKRYNSDGIILIHLKKKYQRDYKRMFRKKKINGT